MLPPSLKSIYQQYKADTDAVANWLATTAKACGYVNSNSVAPTAGGQSGRRLKGKARKQVKQQQQAAQPPTDFNAANSANPAAQAKTHILKIKDFEPMASFLSKIESIKVPDYFAVAIERVVWVRQNFSNGLAGVGGSSNTASDERHSYFAGVLEKVRDLLRPQMEAGVFNIEELAKARSARQSQQSAGPFSNMFSILGVYEPSEHYQEIEPPKPAPPADGQPPVRYVAEQDDSFPDAMLLFSMVLQDFGELRSVIKSLWKEWEQGKRDLASVSVATNLCFELARGMEDDIKPVLQKHGGAEKFLMANFTGICKAAGFDAENLQEPGDQYNLWGYSLAQILFINTIGVLNGYFAANSKDDLVTNYNGKFGWYNEDLGDEDDLSNRENWNQDKTALMEILPDFQFLASNMCRGIVEDEMIQGVGDKMHGPSGGGTPMWLAWAFQIFLDILKPLGARCEEGYKELQRESNMIKNAMLLVPQSEQRDRVLTVATKWDTDPIRKCREQMMVLGQMRPPGTPAFQFLRRNPMHCGLWIHKMRTTFHRFGAQYLATPGAVMATTQLYHALRQEKLLGDQVVWEDLQTFWDMQGNASFFVGDPPTSREAYFKNYCLSIGTSISNWAQGTRTKKGKAKVNVNIANRRNLKINGRVSMLLSARLTPSGSRPAPTAEFMVQVLEEGRRHTMSDGKGHLLPGMKEEANKRHYEGFSPSKLVQHIASVVESEVPELRFDYFAMHNLAWKLLHEIRNEAIGIFGEAIMPLPQEDKLPFVPGYIFSTAAGQVGLHDKAEPIEDLLHIAARVLTQFLEDGKGHVIKDWMITKDFDDVVNLKFEDTKPWGMNKLMKELNKMGAAPHLASAGIDPQCATQ